jgi:hypothetical protein
LIVLVESPHRVPEPIFCFSTAQLKRSDTSRRSRGSRITHTPWSTAAAAGIALVNMIFSLGGFVGPNIVGWFKEATGSTGGAF